MGSSKRRVMLEVPCERPRISRNESFMGYIYIYTYSRMYIYIYNVCIYIYICVCVCANLNACI